LWLLRQFSKHLRPRTSFAGNFYFEFGAENVSRLRRIALNLLKQEETAKCDIKAKRHKAGWDEKYLQKLLGI